MANYGKAERTLLVLDRANVPGNSIMFLLCNTLISVLAQITNNERGG